LECKNGVIHVIDAVLLPPPLPDIVDTAIADGRFTVLVEALQTANLVDALSADGPLTVFAPTDAAFTALLQHKQNNNYHHHHHHNHHHHDKADLLARDDLAEILKYHVIAGSEVMSSDLAAKS